MRSMKTCPHVNSCTGPVLGDNNEPYMRKDCADCGGGWVVPKVDFYRNDTTWLKLSD